MKRPTDDEISAAVTSAKVKCVHPDAQTTLDIARAILKKFGAPQWQPIETAPKDEQIMLAIEFDGPNDWRIKTGYYFSEEQCWKVWGGSWQPTHWMPLPEAPQ